MNCRKCKYVIALECSNQMSITKMSNCKSRQLMYMYMYINIETDILKGCFRHTLTLSYIVSNVAILPPCLYANRFCP